MEPTMRHSPIKLQSVQRAASSVQEELLREEIMKLPVVKDGHQVASIDVLSDNEIRAIQQPLD
jgi:hypothetical protein